MKAYRSNFAHKYIFNHHLNGRKLVEALRDSKNYKYDENGTSYVIVKLNIDGVEKEYKVTQL